MRAYLVEAPGAKRYGATQADARIKRDELAYLLSVKKSDVSIEEVEIELGKAELLEFINELCQALDKKQEGSE